VFDPPFAAFLDHQESRNLSPEPPVVNDHASSISITATAMTTTATRPNNDMLGERLRLYVEENFHDA
jgi:hypothetical protein